jgi:anaerobic magnesium-protoporphyrin IX monomethyl ester cyclase
MSGLEEVQRTCVLLINPFADRCTEAATPEESRRLNGHLYSETPLGLAYIYTYAKCALPQLELHILDAHAQLVEEAHRGMDANWNLLLTKIEAIRPAFVGVGGYFLRSAELFHETCQRVRALLPKAMIVVGGNYATIVPEVVMDDESIDVIVLSEGEATFTELLRRWHEGERLEGLDGVVLRGDDGYLQITPKTSYIEDLSEIPIPDRSVLPMDVYAKGLGRNYLDRIFGPGRYRPLSMTLSRGCPNSCGFCTNTIFWAQKIRYRDVDSIIEEIRQLRDVYGADVITFNDDNLFVSTKKITAILEAIVREKLNIRWACGGTSIRALNKSDALLELAVESGIAQFTLPVESASKATLRRVRKPLRLAETFELVDKIRDRYPGKWINGFFVIGFHFETKEDILETLELAKKLQLDWSSLYIYQPIPGTALYQECVDKGLFKPLAFNRFRDLFDESIVSGVDWDSTWLYKVNYRYNLDINFINNWNLKMGNFAQALLDFEYIISIAPNHALAYRQAAVASAGLGDKERAERYRTREAEIMDRENEFTEWYRLIGVPDEPVSK